jgi:hypothetical protein
LQIGLVAQCLLLVLNQNVLPAEDTGARAVRCARASKAARIQQYAGVGSFRDESWSTRFPPSNVNYFIFSGGKACIFDDKSAPTRFSGVAIRDGVMERPCRHRGRQRTHEVASKKKLPEQLE